jgi:hypothetical protein
MRTCGTYSSYTAGCRCPECKEANRLHCAGIWKRMVARRAVAHPHKWRSSGPKYDICGICGITRKKQAAAGVAA